MNHDQIRAHVGQLVRCSSCGDLWMDGGLRPILALGALGPLVELVRLTKGGLAVVRLDGKEYQIPPRNVYHRDIESVRDFQWPEQDWDKLSVKVIKTTARAPDISWGNFHLNLKS